MCDGDYPARIAFLAGRLRESAVPVRAVLDLGCGTGTVAWGLSREGFRVIAADSSAEMLTEAVRKGDTFTGDVQPPLFICQSMPRLKLAAPVDGVVSTLDSVNYLTRERDLRETFRRVYRYLNPGGRFLFDLNTPYRFRLMDRQTYLDETEESFCVWRTFFSEKRQVCVWQVDLFRLRPDGAWERSYEEHRERAWSQEQIVQFLRDAGFSNIRITGDLSRNPPEEHETRWNVSAEKE
ncbi:MAG: class I SAM-dependent methyltransferase, partial [Oscillibacter sp.]|nr:class I SAM-dependent methyltransferase [Oscillibacter sp.]